MATLDRTITDMTYTPIVDIDWPILCLNQNIYGTNWNDVRTGACGNDQIWGYGGNDTLSGRGGDDTVWGGSGNDRINGDEGNDRLYGQSGNDTINGGDGDDYASGGSGNDVLNMGAGDDVASGGTGNDYLYDYQGGVNTQYGGGGDDLLYIYDDRAAGHYSMDSNRQYGGSGDDKFIMSGGSINAFGGSGDDEFWFYSSDSTWHYVEGQSGTDDYNIGSVNDSLFVQIKGFEDGETMTFHDGFGPGVTDLDSNNNGVLDGGDTYVTQYTGSTAIQNGDLYVLIWEEGYLDADAFSIA